LTITRAPAASAIAQVRSLEPESTSTISSQNDTLRSAASRLFSSLKAMRTAESGTIELAVYGRAQEASQQRLSGLIG
jgi:hypothetical protein